MTRLALGKTSTHHREGDSGQNWLEELRRAGADRFASVGFPKTTDEEWRLTNVSPIAKTKFATAGTEISDEARELIGEASFGEDAVAELVFVNGHFAKALSKQPRLHGAVVSTFLQGGFSEPAVEQNLGRIAQIGLTPLECVNQAGRMLITAGLADGEEDPHGSGRFRPRRGRVELLGRPSTAGGGVRTEGPLHRPVPRFGSDQLLRQPQHRDRVAGRLLRGRVQTDRRHQMQTVVHFLKVLVAGQRAEVPREAAESVSHRIRPAMSDGTQKGDTAGRR